MLKYMKGFNTYNLLNPKINLALNRSFRKKHKVKFHAELSSAYQPKIVEQCESELNYFQPPIRNNERFSLILPPPNITGTLHLGHSLTSTVQDVIVRWKRMHGVETVWVPGFDHAGIATQVIVEKRLWKEKKLSRHDVGRESFQGEIWKWKDEKTTVIENQLKQIGASLDWPRKVFTMDPSQSKAVAEAFIRLFDSGLIYRGDQLVNWSCVLQSAISDIEVDHKEIDGPTLITVPGYDKQIEFGKLTYFAYKFHESAGIDEEVVVATTRPETMLGDVAVAVHPKDDRYSRYIGRNLWHPFRKQTIPIISDDFVDPAFGTGAVKITPAHDHVDFEAATRHNLNIVQVIDEKGNLTSVCRQFAGIQRFAARDIIVSRLEGLGLLRNRQDHKMIVPICSRSKDVVEFLVKPQWFIKCAEMAKKAADDVRQGRLNLEPKHFDKIWFNWLENIRDWCVSRQLWWGHRIPVYFCHIQDQPEKNTWVAARNLEEARCKAEIALKPSQSHQIIVQQDEDVLDTWFSSALLPFTSFGWPNNSEDLKYYPLSLMETGHDILFFWIARMVMLGSELTGKLPFNNILLHGIICDAHGRKMSKSLGNVIAPDDVIGGSNLEELAKASRTAYESGILSLEEMTRALQGQKKMFPEGIPECGADALRFTLCSHNIKSHFINFDIQECYANKLFCNKIWQATKFTNLWLEKISQHFLLEPIENLDKLTLMDRWILSRLTHMVAVCETSFEKYDFHLATAAIKKFLYFEFCDIYLETTKRGLKVADSGIAVGHCWTLTKSLDTALRAVAPFMPWLAQHLHHRLGQFPNVPISLYFPKPLSYRDEKLEEQVENVMEVVAAIRRIKKLFNLTAKDKYEVYIVASEGVSNYQEFKNVLEDLSGCQNVHIKSQLEKNSIENIVSDRIGKVEIHFSVSHKLRKSIELDMPKLEAKKLKFMKELDKMSKMMSGDNYKIKASQQAQEANAKKIAALEDKLARINYIQSLSQQ